MEPKVAPKTYYLTCIALLLLAGLTAALAFVPLGPFQGIVAVGIAAMKALLIVLFFMHVRFSGKLIWLAAGTGFSWLAILFLLSLSDYMARGTLNIPGK